MRKPIVFLLACCLSGFTLAQQIGRNVPPAAKRGEMGAPVGEAVSISGRLLRLSPATQIRNQQNLIVMPETLRGMAGTVTVRYLLDLQGNLARIWILTPQEIATPDPKQP